MEILDFKVTGTVRRKGVLGSGYMVYETADVTLSEPVFGQVCEKGPRRTLSREGSAFQAIDGNLERVGGHEIEVSSVRSSTEIEISYIRGYEV